jgi:hypothetical protein
MENEFLNVEFTRTSVFTGRTRTLMFQVREQDLKAYENGELVQTCFPYLSSDQREFLISGMPQDEWDMMSAMEDEES